MSKKRYFFLQAAITNAFTLGSYFLLYCLQSGKDPHGKIFREDVQGSKMNHSSGKKKVWFLPLWFFLPWVWSLQKLYHVWLFGSLFFITWINESSSYTSRGKRERIRKKWPISGSKWQKKCYEKSGSNLCFLFLSVFSSGLQEVKQSLSRIGQWNKGGFFGWVLPLPLQMYMLLLHFRSFSFLLAMDSACYFYHLADLFQLKKNVKSLFSPFQAAAG